MKDNLAQKKWDYAAKRYKFFTSGAERRWAPLKKEFFSRMGDGNILFLAVGVGSEIKHFPPNKNIVGIDISTEMLKKASILAEKYEGIIELREMDVTNLTFTSEKFDQVFTSCTFCSVADPVDGLKELNRVLKPGGELRMFEHTGSLHFPFRQMLNLMNHLTEKIGPSVNRDTILNVEKAGFEIKQVFNIYLDIVKRIYAVRPSTFSVE